MMWMFPSISNCLSEDFYGITRFAHNTGCANMLVITVHDKVAGTWSPPTVVQNKQSAVRDFNTACSSQDSLIGQHPYDFELYVIGEWTVPYETNKLPKLVAFDSFDFVIRGSSPVGEGNDNGKG